ncbi:hypothetical protein FEM41_11755 [Jejubacter calystegiae]|uniref:Uncharacterized protein n=1 Tax=Jejubacter calystegiae TaxID=2579935 RepID=A0A4P8YKR2_9ENTR|nr:hypothetical protein [Jejubacter calystegiae]QCT20274.1 hypothetical protein FEM41_11755 [Jejubacter calystegiae]
MTLDISHFPLVRMRPVPEEERNLNRFLLALSDLLEKGEPFVLLSDNNSDDEAPHSPDEKVQIARWKNQWRQPLKQYVKGMIIREPDSVRQNTARQFADYASKFWGYPIFVVADERDARQLAQQLLDEQLKFHDESFP